MCNLQVTGSIIEQSKDITFMVQQLQKEIEHIGYSDHPLLHWYLIQQLTKSIVEHTYHVHVIAHDVISTVSDFEKTYTPETPIKDNDTYSTNGYWQYAEMH